MTGLIIAALVTALVVYLLARGYKPQPVLLLGGLLLLLLTASLDLNPLLPENKSTQFKPEKRIIEDNDEKEQRGKSLKENRAVVVSSEEIVLPNRSSNTINDTFNEVSSLLDRVTHIPLDGGESFKQPYMKINSGENR